MGINKKDILVIGGVIVSTIVIIFIGFWIHSAMAPSLQQMLGVGGSSNGNNGTSASPTASGIATVTAVPGGTVAPNAGATNAPSNVAVPAVQSAGDPSGDVSYRSFNISISGGVYSPSTVIVKQGDTVNLELTAADANYAFTQPNLGFDIPIAKGKTQRIQFAALQVGDFIFYCASCGGPSKGPVGHLIVTAN